MKNKQKYLNFLSKITNKTYIEKSLTSILGLFTIIFMRICFLAADTVVFCIIINNVLIPFFQSILPNLLNLDILTIIPAIIIVLIIRFFKFIFNINKKEIPDFYYDTLFEFLLGISFKLFIKICFLVADSVIFCIIWNKILIHIFKFLYPIILEENILRFIPALVIVLILRGIKYLNDILKK